MLVHGDRRAHAVELLEELAFDLDEFAATLEMRREHTTSHDEVSSTSEGLGEVTRAGATSIRDNMTMQTVSSVSTLQDSAELRIANARLLACSADRSWSNTNLHDVRATQNEFLDHLTSDHIASNDGRSREGFTGATNMVHELHKMINNFRYELSTKCGSKGHSLHAQSSRWQHPDR